MGDYNADESPELHKIFVVAFDFKLAPQTKLKVDQFSTGGSNKVYNLTRKIGSTHLRVLVDPAFIPG
jgi:hypothetical protein